MAEKELLVQVIIHSGSVGLQPAFEVIDQADYCFRNNGRIYLEVYNTGAGMLGITFVTARQMDSHISGNPVKWVEATTGHKKFGPFQPDAYNDALGYMHILFDTTVNITVGVFRLG